MAAFASPGLSRLPRVMPGKAGARTGRGSGMLNTSARMGFDESHEQFRDTVEKGRVSFGHRRDNTS